MIDTTELEALRAEVAELRELVEHPALKELRDQRDQRDQALRQSADASRARQAGMARPVWTVDSGTPPPTTVTRQDMLADDAWSVQIDGATWATDWTARTVLDRCEDNSPCFELARRALLGHWRLRHVEMEMVRARSAGDAVTAEMQLASTMAKTESDHIGAELGTMLRDVADALALTDRWPAMHHQEQTLYQAYYSNADVVIASQAMAPLPEIPKRKWFR